MKTYMKILAILLALTMFVSFPCAVFADSGDEPDEDEKEVEVEEEDEDEEEIEIEEDEDEEEEEEDEDEDKDGLKPWIVEKNALELEKDALEEEKDALEERIEELEEQIEAAEEAGDDDLVAELEGQKDLLQEEKNALKAAMKGKLIQMHEVMRAKYTEEEIEALEDLAEELEEEEGIDVIPFTNVLIKGGNVKFDTPPVIKEGRLLLPIRAISTAYGADVSWDNVTKEITVVKDGVEIVLKINETGVTVNGEEVELDVPAGLVNRRTVVPARFIAESLGLVVTWEAETESVIVEQPEE